MLDFCEGCGIYADPFFHQDGKKEVLAIYKCSCGNIWKSSWHPNLFYEIARQQEWEEAQEG